jgi:hypothetical protein
MLVAADAVLDRLGIFVAVEKRLPGIDMFRLVEVAVGQEGEAPSSRWG